MHNDLKTLSQRMIITAAMPFDDEKTIERIINQSITFKGFAVLPSFLNHAKKLLDATRNEKLIGLVGYPSGGVSTKTKVNEIRDLVYEKANEFHVVANVGYILSGRWEDVECELISVIHSSNGLPVSLIMESSYLSDHQIMRLVNLSVDVGVHCIGTSTGWLPMNPDLEQIQKIQEIVYDRLPLMVAGVENVEQAVGLVEKGITSLIIRAQHAEAIQAQLV